MREKKGKVGCCFGVNARGSNVEEIGGSTQGFGPEFGGQGRLNEKSANYIIYSAERAFSLAILWRCVRT